MSRYKRGWRPVVRYIYGTIQMLAAFYSAVIFRKVITENMTFNTIAPLPIYGEISQPLLTVIFWFCELCIANISTGE